MCGVALWTMLEALGRRFLCLASNQENGRFVTNATEATISELATHLAASCSVREVIDAFAPRWIQSLNLQVGASASAATTDSFGAEGAQCGVLGSWAYCHGFRILPTEG